MPNTTLVSNNKTQGKWAPSNSSLDIELKIQSVSVLALVTIISSKNITYDLPNMIVGFNQNSYEPSLAFNYSVVSNTSTQLDI